MDSVIRGMAVYLLLLLVFRLAGKRSLSHITTFDFVLLLIISETVQQALIADDGSVTGAALLVVTLVTFDILLSHIKRWWPAIGRILDSSPVVILADGQLNHEFMRAERVDETDILNAAREHQGLRTLDEIDYAIVEKSGTITVIPKGA